jgi:hypothetical protein
MNKDAIIVYDYILTAFVRLGFMGDDVCFAVLDMIDSDALSASQKAALRQFVYASQEDTR